MENVVMNSMDRTIMESGEGYSRYWLPCIIEETHGGARAISIRDKQFTERKLFLLGPVTEEMANDFVSEMMFLAQTNEPIDICINTPGGSVVSGLVIYDLIQALNDKIEINIYCTGMASSMGAVILAGGQKGRRYIMPHSKVMIHEPLIQNGMGGSATSIKRTAESILETKAIIDEILVKHTGKTQEEIDEATSFDNFMTAEEAIEFGLCDEIRNPI